MRNILLSESEKLLDIQGQPLQYGYAKRPLIKTNNKATNLFRLKEWDLYQITNEEFTVKIAYGHISIGGIMSFEIFDYKGNSYSLDSPIILPLRRLGLAPSADSICDYTRYTKNYKADIIIRPGKKNFNFYVSNKTYGKSYINIKLTHPVDDEGVLVVTPFWNRKKFYHNYKQNCMKVTGEIAINSKNFTLGDKSFGLVNWARGNLPFKHRWWWGNSSHKLGADRFGFNIGVFGDNKFATENALFFNGKTHKLDDISYKKTSNKKFIFTSSDDRFEMEFSPIFDKVSKIDLLYIDNVCHQLFGYWNGYAILDDGRKLNIKDMFAFVEFACNQW